LFSASSLSINFDMDGKMFELDKEAPEWLFLEECDIVYMTLNVEKKERKKKTDKLLLWPQIIYNKK